MCSGKAAYRAFYDGSAMTFHLLHDRTDVAQEQFATSRRDETGIVPEGDIVDIAITSIAITSITSGEVER